VVVVQGSDTEKHFTKGKDNSGKMPLQSFVQAKGSDGKTYKGRLEEVSIQGVSLQIVHARGIQNLQLPFGQPESLTIPRRID
jgi:hypothetical protein